MFRAQKVVIGESHGGFRAQDPETVDVAAVGDGPVWASAA
jgi:hypothetical protein